MAFYHIHRFEDSLVKRVRFLLNKNVATGNCTTDVTGLGCLGPSLLNFKVTRASLGDLKYQQATRPLMYEVEKRLSHLKVGAWIIIFI